MNLSIDDDDDGGLLLLHQADMPGPPLHDPPVLLLFTGLYLTVFLLGCLGNLLTIAVIQKTRDLHSNTNFFLCNLAASDLLLLLSGIPFDLIYMWRTYPAIAGSWHCVLKGQLSETASNVSILTILLVTVERWVAICKPLHLCVYFSRERLVKYLCAIWCGGVVSALFLSLQLAAVPYRMPNSTLVFEQITQCDVEPSRSVPFSFELTSAVFFLLPMCLIVGAYGSIIRELNRSPGRVSVRKSSVSLDNGAQHKARFLVIIMLIAVAGVFFVCFLPLHVQRLMTTYDKERIGSSQENAHFSHVWFTVAGLLHYVGAASNPVIYNVMSRRFRNAFRRLISLGRVSERWQRLKKPQSDVRELSDPTLGLAFCKRQLLLRLTAGDRQLYVPDQSRHLPPMPVPIPIRHQWL